MAIVPYTLNEEPTRRSVVTLAHYAKAIQYSECAVYGVNNPSQLATVESGCRDIWTLEQRNYILRYLDEAQRELEQETGRLFGTTWVVGDLSYKTDHLIDVQTYHRNAFCMENVMYTKWNNVRALGRLVPVVIELATIVDYTSDPAVITVTIDPLVVTDIYKVRVFQVDNFGTDREISLDPSGINISGVTMTIEIPRCRMVDYDLRNNTTAGLAYSNLDNFIEEVDVYYFTTVNEDSLVITKNNCNCSTSQQNACLEFITTGITTVRNSSGCEACPNTCGSLDVYAGLYYEAGESVVDQRVIDMIIRLAHVKMPFEPCGCEIAQRMWQKDREIPPYLSPDQLKCPFGIEYGAWVAYKWAQAFKKMKFGYI